MITPAMIEAGKAAYYGHYAVDDAVRNSNECFTDQITAIYEAMCEQKQQDFLESFGSRSK